MRFGRTIFCLFLLHFLWRLYSLIYIYPEYLKDLGGKDFFFDFHSSSRESSTTSASEQTQAIIDKSEWSDKTVRSLPLRAYIEPSIPYWIPNTATKEEPFGEPIIPLPLRTQSPSELTQITYPKVKSCSDIPKHFPVIRELETNSQGKIDYTNVYNKKVLQDPMETAPYCPVDADPYLPWIHDVFPSKDGDVVHFIAQNKRRCNQGKMFTIEKERLEPQVAIMQPVSVSSSVTEVPETLWDEDTNTEEKRWRLSTIEEADEGGKATRFICHFKKLTPDGEVISLGETLSVFPFNYELINHRKGYNQMLTKEGFDKGTFWLSNLQFDCPVPNVHGLQEAIKNGDNIIEGKSTVYVDVVPIRTPPRTLTDGLHYNKMQVPRFDAANRWGKGHVLPKIKASGRWENIPICPLNTLAPESPNKMLEDKDESVIGTDTGNEKEKKHYLVGCLWASLFYKTRGNQNHVSDTEERLKEWLEFHFLAGFDHIYIYDNTGAFMDDGSNLSIVTDLFSTKQVTRIDWPFQVCNNNIPAAENTGERSSQYAAEASCRSRFGPETEWMASFDTDEYFIPTGKYTDLKDMLRDIKDQGTNVLSFRSTRAMLNYDHLIPYNDSTAACELKDGEPQCLGKNPDATYIETYNCDISFPKPSWADRAKKQIYRPEYVLSHFVHYSTVTTNLADENKKVRRIQEKSERYSDEINEATMLHAKTTGDGATSNWKETCAKGYVPPDRKSVWKCRVGLAYPRGTKSVYSEKDMPKLYTEDGYTMNCFPYEKLTDYWIPKLKEALSKRKKG